ncbi:hypothetical protein, partial [Streptococcus pneumoniae]|uniref:hypothetical protein n=1 Tax=Streptococcus pneumoniae TaxID=1313 RepID=UPI001E3A34CE
IYSYSSEDAENDGILFNFNKNHLSNALIGYATTNLLYKEGYIKDDNINIPNCKDLIIQSMRQFDIINLKKDPLDTD